MSNVATRSSTVNRDKLLAEVAEAFATADYPLADSDPKRVALFIEHYFKHAASSEMLTRPVSSIVGSLQHHVAIAKRRLSGQCHVELYSPNLEEDGWEAGGHTVLTLVTDDQDWLIDSISMTVSKLGWGIRELVHPQYRVKRDDQGNLVGFVRGDDDLDSIAEAWVWIELYPPLGSTAEDQLALLKQALETSLADLKAAVNDHDAMIGRLLGAAEQAEAIGGPKAEIATQMLRWCSEERFLLLGARSFELDEGRLTPLPGGLGILRNEERAADSFAAIPSGDDMLVITKDSAASTVLRASYLDYIGAHLVEPSGRHIERRFLGLFRSSALAEPIARIPALRGKAREISAAIGFDRASYGGRAVEAVLESYPRDDLYEASVEELTPFISQIIGVEDPRSVITHVRPGRWGRFISVLVYMPRERYNTTVRQGIERLVLSVTGASSSQWNVHVSDFPMAIFHVTAKMADGDPLPTIDVEELSQKVEEITRSWDDRFQQIAERMESSQRGIEFPDSYKQMYSPIEAIDDLIALNQVSGPDDMVRSMHVPSPLENGVDFRVKIFRVGSEMVLSRVLPHLSSLGVDIINERPSDVELRGEPAHIYDFGLRLPGGPERLQGWSYQDRTRFTDAIAASYLGLAEADSLNRLITQAGLNWRQVSLLRAISRYLRQLGTTYSLPYIADTLNKNEEVATLLVELFEVKFSPWLDESIDRDAKISELTEKVLAGIDKAAVLDEDKILRQFLAVICAAVRTNFFALESIGSELRSEQGALAIKVEPRKLDFTRPPQPVHEIFVYSPRVEGVHLRFGDISRGGIRWSDRAEDYRTEIMDLARAQAVKNSIIVPAGSKGGFYPRRLAGLTAQARAREAQDSYAVFIKGLLSVTDNVVDGASVHPKNVVSWDGYDSYLVVAADKGTASFSDLANTIAVESGYWLGDAFASGGSTGYDHKNMGITARGAWVSLQRHFSEMGIDPQADEFTCVAIGDMSGDVFGNGMLLSESMQLVAAFNHRHIFIDPNPDPEVSFAERKRLFEAGRSWDGYRSELISEGGGVYSRTDKSIDVSEPVRQVLGLENSADRVTPNEMIQAILRAPVDLMWNGGIGTWVKASYQPNQAADDRANDAVRVDANQVRAKCVVEGGNLGWTREGRVEYALGGGKINTDFIDNCAGVATSDHEVNIKILLDAAVADGQLDTQERNELLQQMTGEIADSVLQQCIVQNRALANSLLEAPTSTGVHDDLITALENKGRISRVLDSLPSSEELAARAEAGQGMSDPELSMVLSVVKNVLKEEILATKLPGDPYLSDRLTKYFPVALRERFADRMGDHPLAREIITTVAVNRFVDSQGLSAAHRLHDETGADIDEIIRAQLVARNLVDAGPLESALAASKANAQTQTLVRLQIRRMVERATRWVLQTYSDGIDIEGIVSDLKPGVSRVIAHLPQVLTASGGEHYEAGVSDLVGHHVDQRSAESLAKWSVAHLALPIVRVAERHHSDVLICAQVYFELSERLGIGHALRRARQLPRSDRWEIMARAAVRDQLASAQAALTAAALESAGELVKDPQAIVNVWWQANPGAERQRKTLIDLVAGPADLSRLSVAVASLRALLDK